MYVSIDLVEEVIERQLRKYRTKLASKKMNVADNFNEAFIDSDADEDEEIKIVRTKRFGMKPMYPEDACVQMELTDTISSYSAMQRQTRSMSYTREKEIHLV